jgi:DNA repair protein RadC
MKLLSQFSSSMTLNEVKVSYKKDYYLDAYTVSSSKKAYEAFKLIYDMDTIELFESFYVLFLDTSGRIIGYYLVGRGGTDAVPVDLKIIYMLALKTVCASIIVAHNHPSGTLYPSHADKILTQRIVEAGILLNINVHDHIILTVNGYYSFKDEGLL